MSIVNDFFQKGVAFFKNGKGNLDQHNDFDFGNHMLIGNKNGDLYLSRSSCEKLRFDKANFEYIRNISFPKKATSISFKNVKNLHGSIDVSKTEGLAEISFNGTNMAKVEEIRLPAKESNVKVSGLMLYPKSKVKYLQPDGSFKADEKEETAPKMTFTKPTFRSVTAFNSDR